MKLRNETSEMKSIKWGRNYNVIITKLHSQINGHVYLLKDMYIYIYLFFIKLNVSVFS